MRQKLGQHFLINKRKINRIIDALELSNNETVIEIGPGKGALTQELLTQTSNLYLLERDPELAALFHNKATVICGNALDTLPELVRSSGFPEYKLVGNLPYYITGHLFRALSELTRKPTRAVFTIQKEVAERIVAAPPRMNLLAASLQCWANVLIVDTLAPADFKPRPRVESAIIVLVPYNQTPDDSYFSFIRNVFKQPRKTLVNNLVTGYQKDKTAVLDLLKTEGLEPNIRPQNLNVATLMRLSEYFV